MAPLLRPSSRALLAVSAGAALALSACGSGPTAEEAGAAGGATPDAVSVVASTDVYGDVAASIAGDRAEVVSIVDDPAQDPHSYEASTRDQLALQRAAIVVRNGGGYDPFVDAMLESAGTGGRTVITATDLAGGGEDTAGGAHAEEHAGEEHAGEHDHAASNEHVWYDLDTVGHVAEELVAALSAAAPADAAAFEANGRAFLDGLTALRQRQEELGAVVDGRAALATEPVAAHLLEDLGLQDRTPAEFVEAAEEGGDAPATALREVLDLLAQGRVDVLVYNEQTSSAQTQQVEEAARTAGVPVVPVTETLPEGEDYTSWMSANLTALEGALAR